MIRRVLVSFLLLLASLAASAQRYPVVDLRATGSERYSSAEIAAASGLQKGRSASLEEVKAAAEKLISSGVFSEVGYRHASAAGGMHVQFTVKDSNQLRPVDFENIVWMSPEEVTARLHERLPLFKGAAVVESGLTEEISKALQEILGGIGVSGHVSYQMKATPVPGAKAIESLQFVVEDVDVRVVRVRVVGAPGRFDNEVEKEAAKIVGETYTRTPLKYFADHSLRWVFASHGYLKARLGDLKPKVLSNEGGTTKVEVEIPVELGQQYTLAGLNWSGTSALSAAKLGTFLHLGSGAPVDGRQFDQDLENIRDQYERRGYMKAQVNALPNYDDAQSSVTYQIAIQEGAQYKMGKLEVEGLAKGSVEKLRNAWKLREGEPYDRTYISQFLKIYEIPAGTKYQIEQEIDEANKIVDTTLVFSAGK